MEFGGIEFSSSDSRLSSACDNGYLESVGEAMDISMTRVRHSPAQHMLDLRTCGLIIYYSATAGGTIEARNPREGIRDRHLRFLDMP